MKKSAKEQLVAEINKYSNKKTCLARASNNNNKQINKTKKKRRATHDHRRSRRRSHTTRERDPFRRRRLRCGPLGRNCQKKSSKKQPCASSPLIRNQRDSLHGGRFPLCFMGDKWFGPFLPAWVKRERALGTNTWVQKIKRRVLRVAKKIAREFGTW